MGGGFRLIQAWLEDWLGAGWMGKEPAEKPVEPKNENTSS